MTAKNKGKAVKCNPVSWTQALLQSAEAVAFIAKSCPVEQTVTVALSV